MVPCPGRLFGAVLAAALVALPGAGNGRPEPGLNASLTVRLVAGRTQYRIGELIPLDLQFRGTGDPDLYFSILPTRRSGELATERYEVTPEGGWHDPLADYFSTTVTVGSILSSEHPLDGSPLHVHVNLNDWIQFTAPGRYELSIASARLRRYSGEPAPDLTSNVVDLSIVPAPPAWARAQVASARTAIEQGSDAQVQDGAVVLRHLGTRRAAMTLLAEYDRLAPGHHFDLIAGLAASAFGDDVAAVMEQRAGTGNPLPPTYLNDLALLRALGDLRGSSATPQQRVEKRLALEAAYRLHWLSAAIRSPSVARFASAIQALPVTRDPAFEGLLGRALSRRPALAREAFLSLDQPAQNTALRWRGSAWNGRWIEPALRRVYRTWRGDTRSAGVGDAALIRLIQIDPARGDALALQEIRTGAHGIGYDALASVDVPSGADLDDALRQRLLRASADDERATSMWLIARYGSDALAPVVQATVQDGVACSIEAGALTYLLEHEPEAAAARLRPGFTPTRGCVTVPWDAIAHRYWDARLEAAAILHARSLTGYPAADAIRVLGSYGSAAVKTPLLERLAAFSAKWRARATELETDERPPFNAATTVENALVNALLQNQHIALTRADVARIRELCVTAGCRRNVDAQSQARPQSPKPKA
ncbi:MAG TPA: hypothetical protein VFX12_02920 [Vicinamibacterales bacterium]|nr:hypothetical protein [Vicinamibacterales bacterium]